MEYLDDLVGAFAEEGKRGKTLIHSEDPCDNQKM